MSKEIDNMLSSMQAAKKAHVNRKTILNWIYRGDLAASRLPGLRGHYRIDPDNLEKAIRDYRPKNKGKQAQP